jgi:hypothetical protein
MISKNKQGKFYSVDQPDVPLHKIYNGEYQKEVVTKREKIRQANMKYLELTSEQLDDWQKIMDLPMNQWPKDLADYLKTNHTGKLSCGDAIACWVADWVRISAYKWRKRYLRPNKI